MNLKKKESRITTDYIESLNKDLKDLKEEVKRMSS
jgi:hypothetical protein